MHPSHRFRDLLAMLTLQRSRSVEEFNARSMGLFIRMAFEKQRIAIVREGEKGKEPYVKQPRERNNEISCGASTGLKCSKEARC